MNTNFDAKNCNSFLDITTLNKEEVSQLRKYLTTTYMKYSFTDYLTFEEIEYTASKKERHYKPDTKTDTESLLKRGVIVTFGAGEALDIIDNYEKISFNAMHIYSILELLAYASASLTKELVRIKEKDEVSKARYEYKSDSCIDETIKELTEEINDIKRLDNKLRSMIGPGDLKIIQELFNQSELFKILSMLRKR